MSFESQMQFIDLPRASFVESLSKFEYIKLFQVSDLYIVPLSFSPASVMLHYLSIVLIYQYSQIQFSLCKI